MSYIWGGNSPTSGNTGDHPVDQPIWGRLGPTGADVGRPRVVPDLYRRALHSRLASLVLVALLFPPLYVLAVLMDWDDRRHGVTR